MDIQTGNQKEQEMSNANPEPIVGNRGASILGPRNVPIERQNPDALIAPGTDAGTVPNLKWPFALSHNRVLSGGFARETTTRELPVSTEIAGVKYAPLARRHPRVTLAQGIRVGLRDQRQLPHLAF